VAKPGATTLGFTAAAATIGPPVCARLAAISLSDSGSKSPTLLLARLGAAVLPDHALRVDVPHLGRPYAQLLNYLLGGVDHGHAGGEGDARAAGQMRIADRRGVGDVDP
jgi:hypothetical protein